MKSNGLKETQVPSDYTIVDILEVSPSTSTHSGHAAGSAAGIHGDAQITHVGQIGKIFNDSSDQVPPVFTSTPRVAAGDGGTAALQVHTSLHCLTFWIIRVLGN